MKFNIRQTKVLKAEEPNILCLAAASAGKTRVITERIRILVEERGVNPSDIVAITFTNMAADEMKRRIGGAAEEVFIGTIHSYGNKICNINGISTEQMIANFNFDEILKRAVQIPRFKFPKIKHLLVDECQDMSPLEYQFLKKIPTENSFFIGDDRQAIYGFRGCSDEFLRNMWKDASYKKYYLTENYRNAPNILSYAENFITSLSPLSPKSIPIKTKLGILEPHFKFSDALDELQWSENWGTWFILTRTNDELVAAEEECDKRGIPNVTFKKGDFDLPELQALINSNRVKILTIHSAKGLENSNVIVTGAKTYSDEERRIAYVAATRAMNSLYWCPAIAKKTRKNQHPLKDEAEAGRIFSKSNQEMVSF